jgi:hypothetical protein
METPHQPASWLLQLPDPCLLAVLRCCADGTCTMFSAARAPSRLHQAAVLAATSIRAVLTKQQQAERLLLYLDRYGQHISSMDLS